MMKRRLMAAGVLLLALAAVLVMSQHRRTEWIVGSDIRSEQISQFYWTAAASTNPPSFQRYHFCAEGGKYLFEHETREGDHWPLREEDATVQGTCALSDGDWARMIGLLTGGRVTGRAETLGDGGSGQPDLFLYWSGDAGKYQVFQFPSPGAEKDFEDFCEQLISDPA